MVEIKFNGESMEDIKAQIAAFFGEAKVKALKNESTKQAPIVTRDKLQEELQKISAIVGLQKTRELLLSFNVKRVSEIEDEQISEIYNACLKMLKPQT